MSERGASKEFKKYVLDEEGYTWYGNEYKRKSRLESRAVTSRNNKKIKKAQEIINNRSRHKKANSYGDTEYI